MLTNPYSPGDVPAYLAGRAAQLEQIAARLARVRELGRGGGPLLAYYGSRGLGKTSLLREAQKRARDAGFLTIWATGRDDAAMTPEILHELAETLRQRPITDRARALLRQLDKVQVELGVPGAKIGVQASRSAPDAAVPASLVLQESLAGAARLAREESGTGLALFVDELQEAPVADRRSLLIGLQHLSGEAAAAPVAVVAAGLPSLHAAVVEAATFGERSDFRELGPLTDVAVAEALRRPAEAVGVRWSDGAVLSAIDAAGGYPHRVQLLGAATWDEARPAPGDVIEAGHVGFGVESAQARMDELFRSRVAKVTAAQRHFLVAMADAGQGDDPVARTDIAAWLGTDSRSLSRTRQELLDRGLVEPAGRGHLRFTIPGFAQFLREDDARS